MATILNIDIESLIFLFWAGLICLTILAIPFVLLYLLLKWLTKKGYRKLGLTLIIAFSFFLVYSTYTAIYPPDSFYFNEFKEVTLRDVPESAKIISKGASYPDFHGDYCSACLISVSENEYLALLNELTNDKRITKHSDNRIIGSDEFEKAMGSFKREQIIHGFTRDITGQEDHYLYIGFLDDNKTIIVSVCVT